MNTLSARIIVIAICGLSALPRALAQETQPAATATQPAPNAEIPTLVTIITNTKDSLPTRVSQAVKLISLNTPEAIQQTTGLLSGDANPSTKNAICQAIAKLGETNKKLLADEAQRLVHPLLTLLGNSEKALAKNAANALDAFPDTIVVDQLATVAGDSNLPLPHRLAAVEVLSHKAYDAHVIEKLIQLVEKNNGDFRPRVVHILQLVTGQKFGNDPAQWKAWWEKQDKQDLQKWYRTQAKVFYARMTETEKQCKQESEKAHREYSDLNKRFADSLHNIYTLTQKPEEKNSLLSKWLAEPLTVYRQTALAILRDNLQDGTLPTPEVAEAVLSNLSHDSPLIRQNALAIIGAMANPASAEKVIQALDAEKDPAIRETALRVLGQLKNPVAIPTLLKDLQSSADASSRCPACIIAASHSLGILAAKGKVDEETTKTIIPVLKECLAATPADQVDVRESFLMTMADICDPGFAEDFKTSLKPDAAPTILLASLQGVRCLQDGNATDTVASLLASGDPRVRAQAIEILAILDKTAKHLDAITARINPANESNEAVRNTAWATTQKMIQTKAPAEQLAWAAKLSATPGREIAWLEEQIDKWAKSKPPCPELPSARLRLASLLETSGQWEKALNAWKKIASESADSKADDAHLHALSIALRLNQLENAKAEALSLSKASEDTKKQAVQVICNALKRLVDANKKDQAKHLINLFKDAPATLGDSLQQCLTKYSKQLNPPPPPATQPTTQPAPPKKAPTEKEQPATQPASPKAPAPKS